MKQIFLGSVIVASLLMLSGCGDELQLTAAQVKNVDKMSVASDQTTLDVYCPTGICIFDLSSNIETNVVVTMHYNDDKIFSKIEGVSVTGRMGSTVKVLGENSFSMDLAADNDVSKIQVVDFYR
ncbi:spore gernimation protein [Photobacterium frigidiphilum]|uniref:Spore gernimation protein n=1 Tax=Photobacterium frigidiphilum TaxID=264736 RepID=A0A2T3JMC6_9GAMM|nr:spore gernimation protein [Photobacterium frigidiphilum]PSU50191.1 spore gernimation protein [Photobacterium frigidiphilum]